jgi:hypothetical protein
VKYAAVSILLLLLVAPVRAAPTPPAVELEAKVITVGTADLFRCGRAIGTQAVTFEVTRVDRGALKVGQQGTLHVMTCFPGGLLVVDKDIVQLDPARVRPGTVLHVGADRYNRGTWFATTDTITFITAGP